MNNDNDLNLHSMTKLSGWLRYTVHKKYISNSNCTEWSAIWSEIKRVITNLHDHEAGGRIVLKSLNLGHYCTTRSAISTLFSL